MLHRDVAAVVVVAAAALRDVSHRPVVVNCPTEDCYCCDRDCLTRILGEQWRCFVVVAAAADACPLWYSDNVAGTLCQTTPVGCATDEAAVGVDSDEL